MIKVNASISVPDEELEFTFARSGGPGGQNVNKVNSKAILKWPLDHAVFVPPAVIQRFKDAFSNHINKEGFVVIASDKYRDQARNIQDCKDKLAAMLASVSKPPKRRKPTKPSRAKKEERLQQKRQKSEKKDRRRKIDY